MVWAIIREGSPGKSATTMVGFVKPVGFKQAVKERELWMSRVVNQNRK